MARKKQPVLEPQEETAGLTQLTSSYPNAARRKKSNPKTKLPDNIVSLPTNSPRQPTLQPSNASSNGRLDLPYSRSARGQRQPAPTPENPNRQFAEMQHGSTKTPFRDTRALTMAVSAPVNNHKIPQTSPSMIPPTPEYLQGLKALVHSEDVLQKDGYRLKELSMEDMNGKKRCQGCNKSITKFSKEPKLPTFSNLDGEQNKLQIFKIPRPEKETHKSKEDPANAQRSGYDRSRQKNPTLRCKFHNGHIIEKRWTCCGQHPSSHPCMGVEFHIPRLYFFGELERLYQFHATPQNFHSRFSAAVAIDCEMGTAKSGDSELIRVTLIDYFSSATLVDALVQPDVEMAHLNTKYSGVTWKDLRSARQSGRCIYGKENARKAVWNFVGPSTIVVGHSTKNDLAALRWIHHAIIDTFLLESAIALAEDNQEEPRPKDFAPTSNDGKRSTLSQGGTAPLAKEDTIDAQPKKKKTKGTGRFCLKTLAKNRLGQDIQSNIRLGHCSLEDAIAARDLVHWHVTNMDTTT